MAEFESQVDAFRAAGFALAALSVDDPARSEPVRQRLRLSFPIVCDQSRATLAAWGMLNEQERGGVAVPGVLVVDRDRRVQRSWVETTATRLTAASVLATVRGDVASPDARIRVGLGDMVMAIGNSIRRGGSTPKA